MSEELKLYLFEEVEAHNTVDDLWIVYNNKVYDVTKYIDEHPGGEEAILDVAGTDATEAFDDIGHSEEAHNILADFVIGRVEGGSKPKHSRVAPSKTDVDGISNPLIAVIVTLLATIGYFYFYK